MVRCAVLGAKGYTGCDLVRILAKHPEVELTFLGSRDDESVLISDIIPDFPSDFLLMVEKIDSAKILESADVIFLALPHTKSMQFVEEFYGNGKVVIDLSADYRLKNVQMYEHWYKVKHTSSALVASAVYGLPELNHEKIKTSDLIANPGCYPTAVLLALAPLLKRGLIHLDSIVVDAKSGMSGAGKNPSVNTHFCNMYENFKAYKINKHQHIPEMNEVLSGLCSANVSLTFVPHLLPILRGILASIYVVKKDYVTEEDIADAFNEDYCDAPFVRLKPSCVSPQTSDVRNTNFCDISVNVDNDSNQVVILSAIDNLMKGASSQAVQNMNIRLGFSETLGLL